MDEHDSEQFPLHFESLRWFLLLEATRWSHLPVTGGWHEQHPQFVDEIMVLFDEKSKATRIKDQRERSKSNPEAAAREAALQSGIPFIH